MNLSIILRLMSCLNPVTILLYKGTDKECFQKVRCRQCEDCKQSMRSAAFVRLKAEYEHCIKEHGMCFFFTLTFADEYVPFKFHRMCFDKRLVQDWEQKFRQEFRRKYGYRVVKFLVSELGHVGTHRPHHHGMLFLYPDDKYQLKSWKNGKFTPFIPFFPQSFAKKIQETWQYGICDISVFDPKKGGIQYIAKYISKFDEEEKLFKDIITRIQMKRGKGNPVMASKYYSDTFPSLHAFMQRYCPFTMISKNLGSTANICDDCIVSQKPIFIDGFEYSIPRYFTDRYVRKEIKSAQEFVTHDEQFSDCENYFRTLKRRDVPSWRKLQHFYSEPYLQRIYHDENHPIDPIINDIPSDRICAKYKQVIPIDLFSNEVVYGPMPYYEFKHKPDGSIYFKQVLPKQSEVSTLTSERTKYHLVHFANEIEDKYYALPPILQDSCSYDIPKLLQDVPQLVTGYISESKLEDNLTPLGLSILSELDELSQVASEWRANARLAKMEQKRKEKMSRNTPYAKKSLSWEQYRVKSRYLSISKKFKT